MTLGMFHAVRSWLVVTVVKNYSVLEHAREY